MEMYYVSLYHKRLENTVQNLIPAKYDWLDIFVIGAVSSNHLQYVCRHTKNRYHRTV